jgi:urease accessory protein
MQTVEIIASVADDKPGCNDEVVFLRADRITLAKRRWRGVAQDGREFGFDLDHRLSDGAVFHRESGKCYVISQAPESVLEIALGSDPSRAAVISWQIGNLHFPVEITDQVIRCADDPAIRLLLSRERVSWHLAKAVFRPIISLGHGHHH